MKNETVNLFGWIALDNTWSSKNSWLIAESENQPCIYFYLVATELTFTTNQQFFAAFSLFSPKCQFKIIKLGAKQKYK